MRAVIDRKEHYDVQYRGGKNQAHIAAMQNLWAQPIHDARRYPMQHILLFALAGALGSLARYGFSTLMTFLCGGIFPWGIFFTNILGCFLFGLVWGVEALFHMLGDSARIVILTGFMGSFTTFSTFIFDSQALLENKNWLALACNVGGQIFLGLLALQLGIRCAGQLAKI
jgi:CrcB protein